MADEKIYTIPLRDAFRKTSVKRTPYAARYIRDYIKKHTKSDDVRIGSHLNAALWARSKPPRRVRVSVVKEGGVAKAELFGFKYEEFRAQPKKEHKGMKEKLMARMGAKAAKKEEEEKLVEGKLEKEEKSEKTEKAEKAAKEETSAAEKENPASAK